MKHLTLVVLLIGLSSSLSASLRAPGDTDIGFDPAMAALAKALETAERIEVYEGLPNPFGEERLVESELRTKHCRRIAGQWFYDKPQEARVGLLPELQRLFDARLFQPWRGVKFCGGFHADYAVALITGKKTLHVLFCFGCHEAMLISETEPFASDIKTVDFQQTTDLSKKSFEELRSLLSAYLKERPVRAKVPSGG